jgi:integrase
MKILNKDGTGTQNLKYLVEDVDRHGNVRVYARRRGQKKRLRATPGTDEFMAEYHAALKELEGALPETPRNDLGSNRAPVKPGSLRSLKQAYFGSADFRRLGEKTRRVRRAILDHICIKDGDKPFGMMESRHVRKLRDAKADFPEAANARVKALRRLFAWAVEAGYASHNPAREVPYLPPNNPDGWHTWTIEEVGQFKARHAIGTKAHLALKLLLLTGVRRSDVVRLGRQMERDGNLCFKEAKGRARRVKDREIPILPELRRVLDATPSGHLTYIITAFGKPFTPAGFGNWFRRRCNEAGLPHCSAHGLRKTGATIAAENGATEHQLMAIFGWDSPKQAAIYTRKANRKKLAAEAMHKLIPDQTENESVPLSSVVASGGTSGGKKP